uniref:Dynein light chain roadblock-type 1 (inferred by orthology to a human protein) n=1 Tax=Strongyloides venezuelensis TaxID=75913 RepID=A0A0K0EYT7_STRVS
MEKSGSSLVIDVGETEEREDNNNQEFLDEENKSSSLVNVSTIGGDEKKSKGWFFPLLGKRHTTPDPQSTSQKSLSKNTNQGHQPTTTPLSSPTSGGSTSFNIFQKLNIFSKPSNVSTTPPLAVDTSTSNNDDDVGEKDKDDDTVIENFRSINTEETFSSPKIERWYDPKVLSPIKFNLDDTHPLEVECFSNKSMFESKLLDELITDFRENKLKAFSQENLEQLRFMHKQQLEISALHAKLSMQEALNSFKDVDKLDNEFDILSQKLEELHRTMEEFSPGISMLS